MEASYDNHKLAVRRKRYEIGPLLLYRVVQKSDNPVLILR